MKKATSSSLNKISFAIGFAAFLFALSLFSLPTPAASAARIIKVAHTLPESHIGHKAAVEYFNKTIEERSNGAIIIEVYPNGQLGGDRQLIESIQLGTVDMVATAAAIVSGFETQFTVLDFPYLFKDKPTAYRALDGELGQRLNDLLLKNQGIRNLIFMENGLRHITNNRGPIRKPDDLKGLKFRTMENPIHQATFKILGANPTPMNFGELYTALQQGTVDAQETPVTIIASSKFNEVQKFLSLTGHFYAPSVLLINENLWQSLTDEERKIISEAAVYLKDNQRRLNDAEETRLTDEMRSSGLMEINELTPEEKEVFIKATKPLFNQMADELKLDPDLLGLAIKAND
ncbi:MAG: DctP family TRAP transporter solute-binding subunit [Synergistaceae bacterium]|jgi:tripartite ATP-independent transporter DctP family solute receptor|nr:DctP family TRAP transporter solute-binding subunit [Synergistaceae bacterium]